MSVRERILVVLDGRIDGECGDEELADLLLSEIRGTDAFLLGDAFLRFLAPTTHESRHAYVELRGTDLIIDGHGALTEEEAAAVQRVLDSRE